MIKEVDEFGTASGQTDKLTQAKKYFDNRWQFFNWSGSNQASQLK